MTVPGYLTRIVRFIVIGGNVANPMSCLGIIGRGE
jgi:hypothetical protein